jgi:ATP-dependent exoDNAse (exonuclease V) beta subunit
MLLKEKNSHPRDARITFVDDTHTYFIDGESADYVSTTTLIHKMFAEFDPDAVISKMMNSPKWPKSPYYGKSREEIKKGWAANGKEAADAGTAMHLNIENFFNDLEFDATTPEFQLFNKFFLDHLDYKPYRTEMLVFDEFAKVSGSVDMIFRDPEDPTKFVLADWKRSKEIKTFNKWQSGTVPLTENLDDCNFVHYSLQLSIYKHILETKYDMLVSETFLVVLHPNQAEYLKIPTMDFSDVVNKLFAERTAMFADETR